MIVIAACKREYVSYKQKVFILSKGMLDKNAIIVGKMCASIHDVKTASTIIVTSTDKIQLGPHLPRLTHSDQASFHGDTTQCEAYKQS